MVDQKAYEAILRIGGAVGSAVYLSRPNFYPVFD